MYDRPLLDPDTYLELLLIVALHEEVQRLEHEEAPSAWQ